MWVEWNNGVIIVHIYFFNVYNSPCQVFETYNIVYFQNTCVVKIYLYFVEE